MFLSQAALRIITVKALTGKTSVGANVRDSEADARDLMRDQWSPFLVVTADVGERWVRGKDLLNAERAAVDLQIDSFVARGVRVAAPDGGPEIEEIVIPDCDPGHVNYLQSLGYEIVRALTGDADPWPTLWRAFVLRAAPDEACTWQVGANAEHGRRFAFASLVLPLDVLADPAPGRPLEGVWADLVAAMEADAELAGLGRYWRSLVEQPALPSWRQAQADLGLTYAGLAGIGLAPLLDHQATPLSEAGPLDEGTIDPLGLTATEDDAGPGEGGE